MLGLKHTTVKLVPHSYKWHYFFQEEVIKIRRALDSRTLHIEHVGSTALPDIAAKPVLDMFIPCEDLSVTNDYGEALATLGYELVTDGEAYKLFIKGDEEARTHHLTFTSPKGSYWNETIKFRDYLLNSPQVAKEYETEKVKLAAQYSTSRRNYSMNKARYIRNILREIDKKAFETSRASSAKSDYNNESIAVNLSDIQDFFGCEQAPLFEASGYEILDNSLLGNK